MTATFNQAVRQGLANLMAREQLTVVHAASAKTAFFDTKQRMLTLPVWHVPDAVYNMLLAHEVGHALYTPADFIEQAQAQWPAFSPEVHKDLFNMLEDMRIDRAIQRQYPGVRRDYTVSTSYMYDHGILLPPKDIALDTLTFPQRALLHHRIGHLRTIPFSAEERPLLTRAMTTMTLADVVALVRDLADMPPPSRSAAPEHASTDAPEPQGDASPLPSGHDDAQDSTGAQDSATAPMDAPSAAPQEPTAAAPMASQSSATDPMQDWLQDQTEAARILRSHAYERRTRSQQVSTYLIDTLPPLWERTLLTPPLVPITDRRTQSSRDAWVERGLLVWQTAKERAQVMAATFRNHKAAALSSRERQATTGVLDMQKLFSHQWNTKLFKQITLIPKGQSHSLLLLLDWSASMRDMLCVHSHGTDELGPLVRDLLTLVEFCRLCQIPYEVRSWTTCSAVQDSRMQTGARMQRTIHQEEERERLLRTYHEGQLHVVPMSPFWVEVASVQVFSSRWSREQHRMALTHLLEWVWGVTCRNDVLHGVEPGLLMGRTPLAEVLSLIPTFLKPLQTDHRFVLVLTDGEATGNFFSWEPSSLTDVTQNLTVSVPSADSEKHAFRKERANLGHAATSLLTLLVERARQLTGAHLTCYLMGGDWKSLSLDVLRNLQVGKRVNDAKTAYRLPENYLKHPMPLFIGQAFGWDEYILLARDVFQQKSTSALTGRLNRATPGSKAFSNALVALEVAKRKDRPFLQQLGKMIATRFTAQEMPRG